MFMNLDLHDLFDTLYKAEMVKWADCYCSVPAYMAFVDGIKTTLDAIDPSLFDEYTKYGAERAEIEFYMGV